MARYYDAGRGTFFAQDPAFLTMGVTNFQLLEDPQQLNSYSYARNNPLILRDASGRLVELVSRPVELMGARWIFGHTFLRVTPILLGRYL